MTWNYRVMLFPAVQEIDEPYYGIVEVYYDDQGKPSGYTENPVRVTWDEGEDGVKMLVLMAKAFALPVLTPKDFGG